MCLIIQTNATKEIPKGLLENFIKRNNDGYGFMWIQDNKIHTYKTEKSEIEELQETYFRLKEFNPFIHFRMQTHGLVNHNNTHPYYVGWGIYLMHNGIIHDYSKNTDEDSDTQNFINQFLKPLLLQTKNPHKAIRTPIVIEMLEKVIGIGNKLVLGDRGGFVIVNKQYWHTIDNEFTGITGCLVSNTYAWDKDYGKPSPVVVSYGYNGYQNSKYYQNAGWEANGYQFPHVPKQTALPLEDKEDEDSASDNGFGFFLWKNNLFYDDKKLEVWCKRGTVYTRRADLDHKLVKYIAKKLKKSNLSIVHTVKEPEITEEAMEEAALAKEIASFREEHDALENEIAFKAEIQGMTQDDYERILVNEWTRYSPAELCNAVYSEPDEAAIVLYHLAHHA